MEGDLDEVEVHHICADEDMIGLYGRMGPEAVSGDGWKKERA